MNNQNLSAAQANLKLSLWNAEAESANSNKIYEELQELGLPEEVVSRLHELINFIKKIAGKTYAVGKILILKILEFIKTHPFLVAGMGIGAVIGATIAGLITSIPFLGQLLAPLAAMLGVTVTITSAVIGHRLDKKIPGVGEDIFEIIQQFFSLFSDVFNTVFYSLASA